MMSVDSFFLLSSNYIFASFESNLFLLVKPLMPSDVLSSSRFLFLFADEFIPLPQLSRTLLQLISPVIFRFNLLLLQYWSSSAYVEPS
jgi:hypothetical protein